jgi:hypothetical protein
MKARCIPIWGVRFSESSKRVQGKTLLSQKHYAEDVLRTYDYWDCIPALTPMTPGSRLTKEQCDTQCDPRPDPAFHRRYRGIVGSLGYLVNMTRPDLAWSYSELSKYVQNPGKAYMDAAHHVLRYLQLLRATYDQAIVYERTDTLANTIWGWVDSDWAADLDSRRSHTGYILMLSGGAVSWKSRRQDCVSLSTLKRNMLPPANADRRSCTFAKSSVILVSPLPDLLVFMRTILLVRPCRKTLSVASIRGILIFAAISSEIWSPSRCSNLCLFALI